MWGQLPPNQLRSMIATEAPRARASLAAASPAGPAPTTTKSKVSIGSVSSNCADPALSAGLVQDQRGRDRDIQAVGDAVHLDRDWCDPRVASRRGEAVGLAAEHDCQRP